MGNYIPFFRCSKVLGEAGKQDIVQRMLKNSRSQIVFRTDIFTGSPSSKYERRRASVSIYKDLYGLVWEKKTYRFCNLRK